MTEYRGWITIPGVDAQTDAAERLLGALEQRRGDLGPVLGGDRNGLQVVVAIDAADKAAAAAELYAATAAALRHAGLADRYPTTVELEPTGEPARERPPVTGAGWWAQVDLVGGDAGPPSKEFLDAANEVAQRFGWELQGGFAERGLEGRPGNERIQF